TGTAATGSTATASAASRRRGGRRGSAAGGGKVQCARGRTGTGHSGAVQELTAIVEEPLNGRGEVRRVEAHRPAVDALEVGKARAQLRPNRWAALGLADHAQGAGAHSLDRYGTGR